MVQTKHVGDFERKLVAVQNLPTCQVHDTRRLLLDYSPDGLSALTVIDRIFIHVLDHMYGLATGKFVEHPSDGIRTTLRVVPPVHENRSYNCVLCKGFTNELLTLNLD